jgi:hypothetical protein
MTTFSSTIQTDSSVALFILGDNPTSSIESQFPEWNTQYLRYCGNTTVVKNELINHIRTGDATGIHQHQPLDIFDATLEGDRLQKRWELQDKMFSTQQAALRKCENALLSHTTTTVQAAIQAQLGGADDALDTSSLPVIYAALKLRFGERSGSDLADLRKSLGPYIYKTATSFTEHVAHYTRTFSILASANNPIAPSEQIDYFVRSITQSSVASHFMSAIIDWSSLHPLLTSPARTFANLATRLTAVNRTVCDLYPALNAYSATAATTSSHTRSMGDRTPSPTPRSDSKTVRFKHNRTRYPSPNRAPAVIPATSSTSSSTGSSTNSPNYCWTHGSFGHKSSACKNPQPGHKFDATHLNPQGGTTVGTVAQRYTRTQT